MKHEVVAATREAARAYDVPEAHALAFVEVESNGVPFADVDGTPRALIRYEGHYLYRFLAPWPQVQRAAVQRGFASPRAGGVKNPKYQEGRYELLRRVVEFLDENGVDADLAYQSISIGLGQVMGAHYLSQGYHSAEQMLAEAHDETTLEDVEDQVGMIFRFLEVNHLLDEVRAGDWHAAARGYNGPAYARYGYHTKLATAVKTWEYALGVVDAGADQLPVLGVGRSNPAFAVRHLQERLSELRYHSGAIDGDFGPATRGSVLAFQADNDLETDGIVGEETWTALEAEPYENPVAVERSEATVADLRKKGSRTIKQADAAQAVAGVGAVTTALSTDTVQGLVGQVAGLNSLASGLDSLTGILADNWVLLLLVLFGGAAFVAWRVKRARVEDHRSGANLSR